MDGSTWVGIGLSILGIGLPSTVALLRLLPVRESSTMVQCPIREHEQRMAETEKSVAVIQGGMASINAMLLRIEAKLDRRNGAA